MSRLRCSSTQLCRGRGNAVVHLAQTHCIHENIHSAHNRAGGYFHKHFGIREGVRGHLHEATRLTFRTRLLRTKSKLASGLRTSSPTDAEAHAVVERSCDVVVIGSGIGGLSCGALLAKYGMDVIVCEAHNIPGGAAHAWTRDGYTFESGPSLYSGMSDRPSNNPMGQVLHALDEELDCYKYDTWMCHLPDEKGNIGSFQTRIGNDGKQFMEVLEQRRPQKAVDEWRQLIKVMKPLADASSAIPPMAVRNDLGAIITLGRLLPNLIKTKPEAAAKLLKPFSDVMEGVISDDFLTNWMDMLCFLLSGRLANDTLTAEIGFMFNEWYKPDASLEFPIGGSGAIISALLRGLEKNGGKLYLNSEVEKIMVNESGKAIGVQLKNCKSQIHARKAVVSNVSIWDTAEHLLDDEHAKLLGPRAEKTGRCESFMHAHLGIDATGLDDLEIHHIYIKDWAKGVNAPQNLCLVSIPSVLDPTLAPKNKHVVHAYTPGTEPYDLWKGLKRSSQEYKELKDSRSQILFEAISKAIPDIEDRIELKMIGTPLTHERFLRRQEGTYGGFGWLGNQNFLPSPKTPIENLFLVGDSQFPGPGVPAVAAGGAIMANSLASFISHNSVLDKVL